MPPRARGFSFGAFLMLPFGNYQNSFICLHDLFFVCLIPDIKMMGISNVRLKSGLGNENEQAI
jgi:hypothetical protein